MSSTPVTLYSVVAPITAGIPLTKASTGAGQGFPARNTGALTSATFNLARSQDVSGTILAALVPGGISAGAIIGQSVPPIAVSDIVDLSTVGVISASLPQGAPVTFNFPTMPVLEAGVLYCIVVQIQTFSGTEIFVFGNDTNPDPASNSVTDAGFFVWTANTLIDVVFNAVGIQVPIATLTVISNFSDGSPAAPVTVTVHNPGLNILLTQTSACGRTTLVFPGLASATGYFVSAHYVDCAGTVQDIVSPLFQLFTDQTISLGGTSFLPNFFLIRPAPTGIVAIDRVFPDVHHFDLAANPSGIDTLTAIVENASTTPLCVTMQWVFTNPDGSTTVLVGITTFTNSVATACDFITLQPGQSMNIVLNFKPQMLGGYSVTATAFFDRAIPAPRFASNSKSAKFDVVA